MLAIRTTNAVGFVVRHRKRDVAAVIGKVGAEQARYVVIERITAIRNSGSRVNFESFVIILQDDIDGSGYGIRTIDRRTANEYIVDPLDKVRRDDVEIDLNARCAGREQRRKVGRNDAATVHEAQRTVRTQAEGVYEVDASTITGLVATLADAAAELREFVQSVGRIGDVAIIIILRADRAGGLGAHDLGATDTRTGDDDGAFGVGGCIRSNRIACVDLFGRSFLAIILRQGGTR